MVRFQGSTAVVYTRKPCTGRSYKTSPNSKFRQPISAWSRTNTIYPRNEYDEARHAMVDDLPPEILGLDTVVKLRALGLPTLKEVAEQVAYLPARIPAQASAAEKIGLTRSQVRV